MGPRIYTPREASALVPKLTKAFDEIDAIRGRLKAIKGKVDVYRRHLSEGVAADLWVPTTAAGRHLSTQ